MRRETVTDSLAPDREDVEVDTYALVIHESGQNLYQYEEPTPWEDPEWIPKREYDHDQVPPLNLTQTQVEQQTNGESLQTVTLYATDLDADIPASTDNSTPANGSESTVGSGEDPEELSHQGYVLQFSDGKMIPDPDEYTVHTTQDKNMGAAVDYLIQEYDLIDAIEIPYFPAGARKNCSLNTKPEHPNGDKMNGGGYETVGGYYLHTSLNREAKQSRLEDLSNKVGLSVDGYFGKW